MDSFSFGLTFLLGGAGIYASVRMMRAMEQKIWERLAVVLMIIGVVALGYHFVSKGADAEDVTKGPFVTQQGNQPSQTMTDSPGGVQIQGDVTVNQGLQARKLTPAQEKRFVRILKDNPKGHVMISCIESGGPEPCDFARQLKGLLESRDAGWTVTFSPIMFGAGDPTKIIPALYLEAQSNDPHRVAFALKEALTSVLGREPECFVKADQPPDFLQLTVWHNSQ